jgi:hypothetical protein
MNYICVCNGIVYPFVSVVFAANLHFNYNKVYTLCFILPGFQSPGEIPGGKIRSRIENTLVNGRNRPGGMVAAKGTRSCGE